MQALKKILFAVLSGSFSNLRKFLHTYVLRAFSRSPVLCLWTGLPSLIPCPGNIDHLGCPELPTLFSHLRDSSGISLGLFLCSGVWKLTPGDKQTGSTIGLISFVSSLSGITALHCLLLNVWKPLFLIFSQFICCFRREEKLGPVTPIWLKAEVSIYDETKFSNVL